MFEALVGIGGGGLVIDAWSLVGDIQLGVRGHSVAVVGDFLYVFGGFVDATNKTDALTRYDLITKETVSLAVGPSGRAFTAMAAIGTKLYVYGGAPMVGQYAKDLWCYDTTNDTWTQLLDGVLARHSHTLTAVNGKLYLYSGKATTETAMNAMYCYDPALNTWTKLSSSTQGNRYNHIGCELDGIIYFQGGFRSSNLRDIFSYNTLTDSWTTLTPINTMAYRAEHVASIIGRKMFVYGGDSQSDGFVWCYDIDTDSWSKRRVRTPWPRWAASFVYNEKMYVYGGYASPTPLSTLWQYTP